MPPLAPILGLTFGSSLLGLVGGFLLLWRAEPVRRWSSVLIAFAAGGLLAAVFLDLLPEALEHGGVPGSVFGAAFAGVLVFFAVEKFLLWHHHSHTHDTEADPTHPSHLPAPASVRPLIIVGDAVHNFLDGAVIAIAYGVEPRLGLVTALAVLAHELPQEIGDFGILVASGMKRGPIILWNVLGALVSPLGAIVGVLAASQLTAIEPVLLGFAAGTFVYIALADLFPSITHVSRLTQSVGQFAALLVGILVIWGTNLLHVG